MRHAQDETEKTKEAKGKPFASLRAENETRTRDLRITNASLYQLSYFGNANLSIAVQKYAFLPTLPNYPPVIFRKRGIIFYIRLIPRLLGDLIQRSFLAAF